MKLESWDTWLARMDLKQLIFKNLPFGWMLNLLDLGWSQNAFETSWVMVMLEIVGCSVRTLEVILNHLKLHSKWRHPGSRQPKVVSWSSVFTSIEHYILFPNALETWEKVLYATVLQMQQRWVRKGHIITSLQLRYSSMLKTEGAWMKSLVFVLCMNFTRNIYHDVLWLPLWKDTSQMGSAW